jgi:pyridoxal phosphate enzyme (YggS family)
MSQPDSIFNNLARVKDKIHHASRSVNRTADQVRLIVVTKGHSLDMVQAAIDAGVEDLGENYVEESLPKIDLHPSSAQLRWHMIGHIQSRKAKAVSQHFDWVHSVDSVKLARRLDRFAGDFGRTMPFLFECNVSGEETKYGWPAWDEMLWEALLHEIEPILELEHLSVRGLMTMAPFFDDPEHARPYFQRLRSLQEHLAGKFSSHDWSELSMGMSGDFEVAIQEGATMVRIGTAILGERPAR